MLEVDKNQKLKDLERKRDNAKQRCFVYMFEIFFIFGVPAAIAFFAGDYFDDSNGTTFKFKLIALATSFVLSWIIMVRKYIKIDRELNDLDRAIREAKKYV